MDRARACLKSVLRLGVNKDYRTSNWVLILYQTCTTIGMNCKQELKIVYSGDLNYSLIPLIFVVRTSFQNKIRERKAYYQKGGVMFVLCRLA